MRKIILSFILLAALFGLHPLHAQQNPKELTIKISTEQGRAMEGVNISLLKNGKTFSTDKNGHCSLSYESNEDSVVISHIGYHSVRLSISDLLQTSSAIRLQPIARELKPVEVVSDGYQRINKERATGSFEFVNTATLNKQVYPNILSRLETTTSLMFDKTGGNKPAITIRGLSSINSSKDPLVILNNFPYNGDINNINPNDIENVTILKDAAASSIWGTRAGNGVIVITTKKALQNQPFKMEFNSNLTYTARPDLSYLKTIDTKDFLDAEQFLFSKKYRFSDTANSSRPSFTPLYELLFLQQKGQATSDQVNKAIADWSKIDIRNQFERYMYQPSNRQQYALNMRGGSRLASYYIGLGYDKSINELNASYERYTVRSENVFQPVSRVTATIGLAYTNSYTRSGNTSFGALGKQYAYEQFKNDAGAVLPINYALRQPYIDTAGGGRLLDWNFYPAINSNYDYSNTRLNEILATAGLGVRIINGLQLSINYQFQQQNSQTDLTHENASYFTRDLINQFSSINGSTGAVTYRVPNNSILDRTFSSRVSQNLRLQAEFNRSWQLHSVSAIAGGEIRQIVEPTFSNRIFGYDMNLQTATNTDLVNTYPNYVTGFQSNIPGNYNSNETNNRFASQFANAAYTYRSTYTLSGSIRRDASNLFGVSTNNKWQPLWSTGASWLISKEKFYNISWLPMLKLRATFGYSGNVNNTLAAVTTIRYFPGSAAYTNFPYSIVSNFANPDLRWENVQMTNIGVDFSLAKDVFSGSIEYYHKNSTDLIGDAPLDPTTGLAVTYLSKNIASMAGDGLELAINATPVKRKLVWQINFLLSVNHNRITNYYISSTTGSSYLSNGQTISPLVGKPVFAILSYKWAWLDGQGNPQGYLNGQPSIDYTTLKNAGTQISDLAYGGPSTPTTWGSLIQTFTRGNWQFDFAIGYKFGYNFRKPSINYNTLSSSYQGHADYARRWQKAGDESLTYVPSFVYPLNTNRDNFYNNSEVLVRQADHIRLRFVNLSYSLHRSSLRKLPADQIQFYFNAANLGLLWKANKDGIDPDYYSYSSFPLPPSYTLGLRLMW